MAELQPMGAQWFPIYYPMGPRAFLDASGSPSGDVGAVAELTKDLPNWPIMFFGLRITNVYELPNQPTDTDIRVYEACKRYVDDEQTVRISLSQQNITSEQTLQVQLTGKSGVYWAPFSVPFPMSGGNNVSVTVQRATPYPLLNNEKITPVCYATITAAVARNSEQTIAPMRIGRG